MVSICPQFSQGQQELINRLLENHVVFLVVGGQAVRAYLPSRETSDVDILLSTSGGNARRLANVFKGKKSPVAGVEWEALFVRKGIRFAYPDEQCSEVDMLTSIDGIDFGECYKRGKLVKFGNIQLKVPCLLDLIMMKRISLATGNDAVSHEKDEKDIRELQNM